MARFPSCEACGVTLSYSPYRAGDCLNPDCIRCWYGFGGMSAAGIVASLEVELARKPVSHFSNDGLVMPRALAVRLVEILSKAPA